MNKTETALLYFPDSTPKVAVRHLMRWIARCAPLLHALEATGYHPCQKSFTCRQLQLVYLHLGRTVIPPGICHRLSENSSSLFERGLRGKNKEGSVPPLKSPHDASAGRVPGQFPQRVKRGRKGSRRTDVKLSLQCQKEEAATRHKITKILVQDSADLAPSFTERRSSVRLAPT